MKSPFKSWVDLFAAYRVPSPYDAHMENMRDQLEQKTRRIIEDTAVRRELRHTRMVLIVALRRLDGKLEVHDDELQRMHSVNEKSINIWRDDANRSFVLELEE